MADINGEVKVSGVYGGVEFGGTEQAGTTAGSGSNLPVQTGFWTKVKSFLFQEIDWNKEIKVELTPYEQKVEKEVNDFLHQEITWQKIHDFLFQEITFGKKDK